MSVVVSLLILPSGARSQTASTMYSVSTTDSYTSGTKQSQTYTGSALVSHVNSDNFCDPRTLQYGVYGTASDSISKSAPVGGTVTTVPVIANDATADLMWGFGGKAPSGPAVIGTPSKRTDNFLSASATYYMNNSLGVGLEQMYVGTYQRYLTRCNGLSANTFFAAATIGVGFADQRLYATPTTLRSAVLPIGAQATWFKKPKDSRPTNKPATVLATKAPPVIISGQVGYTPFLNDLHAYQILESVNVVFPTEFKALTVVVQQSNTYLNNAPATFKRDFQTYGIQLSFSLGGTPPATPSSTPGACYTADKSSHMFCYAAESQSACVAPAIFRQGASCGNLVIPEELMKPLQIPEIKP